MTALALMLSISLHAQCATSSDNLSEEQCRSLAARLSTAIESADLPACSKLFNTDAYIKELFEGLEFKYRNRQEVANDWLRKFKKRHAVYAGTVAAVHGGGSYRPVHVRADERQQLVMRLLRVDGVLDYHFLTLKHNNSSELEIVDTYTLRAGDNIFSVLRTTLERYMIFEGDDGRIVPEAPGAKELIYEKRVLAGIQQSSKSGKHGDVLRFYSRLPKDVQREKYPLLIAIQSAVQLELAEAATAKLHRGKLVQRYVDSFARTYPDNPAVYLLTIDYHMLSEQYSQALKCLERVDKAVGGDPYIELLKAQVHAADGNRALSQRLAENALRHLRDLPDAYLEVASICAGQGKFERVTELLTELESRFEITVDESVVDAPEWKQFFESPEYNNWISNKVQTQSSGEESPPSNPPLHQPD